jgi:hypothetical protein
MLSVSFSYCHAECRHAECRHAECRGVNIVHGLVCNAVKVDVAVAVRERERGGEQRRWGKTESEETEGQRDRGREQNRCWLRLRAFQRMTFPNVSKVESNFQD